MVNPKEFSTETDNPVALEAQKKAFEAWRLGGTGKAVMFFPTITNPADMPSRPIWAIEVGNLVDEPGLFWVHNEDQVTQVLERIKDGSWWKLLGIVEGTTPDNEHEFTRIVVAMDPETGVEWYSVKTRNLDWAIELQTEELKRQFPNADIRVFWSKEYTRK